MLILLPTLIALVAAAGGFVIAIRARKSVASLVRTSLVPPSAAVTTRAIVSGVRLRMLVAVVLAVLAAVVLVQFRIGEVQVGMALAPGIGAAVGLLVLGVSPFPRRVPESGLRQAELTPRTLGAFGPRWGFILPILAGVLLVALLVVTAVSASPVEGPFSHEFMVVAPDGTNSAGPYPDWSYGVFVLTGTVALIAAMLFALHRVATAPRIGQRDAVVLDGALRATLTRFIMLSGTAVIVLYLGAVSLTAGEAARSASQWAYVKPSYELKMCGQKTTSCSFIGTPADTVSGVVQPSYTLGAIGATLGIVLIGVAIALALLAITNFAIRWSVDASVESERVDA